MLQLVGYGLLSRLGQSGAPPAVGAADRLLPPALTDDLFFDRNAQPFCRMVRRSDSASCGIQLRNRRMHRPEHAGGAGNSGLEVRSITPHRLLSPASRPASG